VLPGEAIATFGDALNRLSAQATYLYADQGRYWYGVQPSVAQVARTRAERLLTEAHDDVHAEIVRRLREDATEANSAACMWRPPQAATCRTNRRSA
jgi:hypothetical protein